MSASDIIITTSSGLAIIVVIIGIMKWVIKSYLSELKPNSGSSLHDVINLEMLPIIKSLEIGQSIMQQNQQDMKEEQQRAKIERAVIRDSVSELKGRFHQYVDDGK